MAAFFVSCHQFENVQHIRTSILILENLSLSFSLSPSYSLDLTPGTRDSFLFRKIKKCHAERTFKRREQGKATDDDIKECFKKKKKKLWTIILIYGNTQIIFFTRKWNYFKRNDITDTYSPI